MSPLGTKRTCRDGLEGRYKFRSIMPSGYGCPPGSHIETLLADMGEKTIADFTRVVEQTGILEREPTPPD
jgi:hypothetical protein